MHIKTFIVSLVLLSCVCFSTDAYALDGKRKGFILSFGIGPSLTSYTQSVGDFTSDRENDFGVGTDFRIGYAPSNQFMIYYTNKVTWILGFENALDEKVTIVNGVGLLGLSYYFETAAPSIYFTGTIGVSSWSALEDSNDAWSGFGLGAGIGYEFSKYWSTEFNFMWGNPGDSIEGIEVETNAIGIMFTVNATWY